MWETARATDAFAAAIAGAPEYRREIVRLFGIPESEIANTLRAAEEQGLSLAPLEITTCLRRGEIEVATSYEPPAQPAYDAFLEFLRSRHADTLFSADGSTIDEQVAGPAGRPHRSLPPSPAPGGGLAERLTDRAGSSAYFLGALVVYSNEAKVALAGVDPALIERVGAVSIEVAEALADGAATRLGAGIGVGITGIAGPGGGTEEKPVGTVCISAVCTRDGRADHPQPAPAGRTQRRPRPLGHGLDAPAAPAAARRARGWDGRRPRPGSVSAGKWARRGCSWRSSCRRRCETRSTPGVALR